MESQFVNKVASIPIVSSVSEQVMDVYIRTKNYNPLLKYTIEKAEDVVKYGTETAKPLVNKFEKPISMVDNFAVQQLNKIEKNYPLIVNSSKNKIEEVKQYSYDKVNNVKNYGYEKVMVVKNYGSEKINIVLNTQLGKEFVDKLEQFMDFSEKYLDLLIPPSEDESKEFNAEKPKNTVQRLTVLSGKAQARVHCQAVKQLEKLKKRAEDIIGEMRGVLNALKEKTTVSVKNYNERVQNLWLELIKEENITADSWRDKLLQNAKFLAKSLSHVFSQAATIFSYLSTATHQRLLEAKEQANNLYNTLKTPSSAGEITNHVLHRVEEILGKLQDMLVSIGNFRFSNKEVEPKVHQNDEVTKYREMESL